MGLAAGQARLLSITSRLSDNELRSQTITTAKMALANKTSDASAQYMDALSASQLMFSTYDAKGNKMTEKLSGVSLTEYAPLKNQYGIINTSNQIMVSERDSTNYLNSATLGDFLDKYDVADVTKIDKENPAYVDKATTIWGPDWKTWDEGGIGDLGGLNGREPQQPDYTMVVYEDVEDNSLYPKFKDASASCYSNATGGSPGCYLHVLAHLLDLNVDSNGNPQGGYPKSYNTTYGQGITVDSGKISGSAINGAGKSDDMMPISDAVCGTGSKVYYAAEDAADKAKYEELLKNPPADPNALLTGKLLSNYYTDASGETKLKTLKQKVIDLYYVVENRGSLGVDYNSVLLPALERFQEDMKLKEKVPHVELDVPAWEKAHKEWEDEMQKQIEELHQIEPIITEIKIDYTDKDQAQWYVNLWHRMNGPADYKVELEGFENGVRADEKTKAAYGEVGGDSSPANGLTAGGQMLWTVIEDGLRSSSDWLKYALENGYVSLERVHFTDPTEDGTGLADVTWTSIMYNNATDISETQNERAITKAEIQYQQTTSDIQSKDKQFDSMLKRLDTEHSALQTEFDSIKTVIGKSIERNLKLYS